MILWALNIVRDTYREARGLPPKADWYTWREVFTGRRFK